MTLISKFQADALPGDAPIIPAAAPLQPDALPVDDQGLDLANGESVLTDPVAEPTAMPDDDSGPAFRLVDLAPRAASVLGVSMGQATTALASFGPASSGLFALAESDPDAVQMTPMQGCSCMACLSAGSGGGNGVGAPGAAISLQGLANYLRVTFWDDFDNQDVQYYNVTNSGTGANNGVLYYNVTGTPSGGVSTYYGTYTDTSGVLAGRQTLIRDAFAFYEELLGIDFIETTSTTTEVDFFFIDNQSGAFQAPRFHSGVGGPIDVSIININSNWQGGESNINGYTYQTVLHEIGHALGLGHQGLYNGSGGYAGDALFANDSWAQSMMSYFSQTENTEFSDDSYAFLIGPSAADFIALNDLYASQGYGINNAFNGNTTYGVGTNITATQNRQFNQLADLADTNAFTIVDADGTDKVDFSNYSANQSINLTVTLTSNTRATLSSVGGLTKNMMLAAGTIIENAETGDGNDTLTGNQYNNELTGNAGNDLMYGGNGIDTLYGGDDNDTLYGGNSGDTLKGGGGADVIYGESGSDFSKGGAGNDVIYAGSGADTILGDEDNDRVILTTLATLVAAEFYGGTETDTLEVDGDGTYDLRNSTLTGFEEIEYGFDGADVDKNVYITGAQAVGLGAAARIDGANANGADDRLYIYLETSGTTVLDMSGWIMQDWVQDTQQGDFLGVYGGDAGETVTGTGRNDYVSGGGGNDILFGGNGTDTLKGGAGNDSLDGGGGTDVLFGGDNNDSLYGGASNDSLSGDDGNDVLYAGTGTDTLQGGGDADTLFGDASASTSLFYGAAGNDWLYKASGTTLGSSESWYGGDDNDWLVWTNTAIGSTRVVNLLTEFITSGGNNRDIVQGIENVWVQNGAGVVGDGFGNQIWASGEFANDLDGGAGNDTLKGGAGNDTLRGGISVDYLLGEAGDDTLYDGNDLIGIDSLYGGLGNDTLVKESATNFGIDKIFDGGDDTDLLDWANPLTSLIGTWVVNLATGRITFDGGNRDVLSGIENVTVRNFANVIGDGQNNVLTAIGTFSNSIDGGAGSDTINAGDGADTLLGGEGNDSLQGGTGNDLVFGNDNDDTLDGWTDNDTMYGGTGVDRVLGFTGDDSLFGGAGTDSVFGEDGNDVIVVGVGEGIDWVYGGDGTDTLDYSTTGLNMVVNLATETYTAGANSARDIVGIEVLLLGSGKDSVTGSAAAEWIDAGSDNDTVAGGGGADTLLGGVGVDLLITGSGAASVDGGGSADTILVSADLAGTPFLTGGAGVDWLDLSLVGEGLLVDLLLPTITASGFTATIQELENVQGTALNDTLRGSNGGERLHGGGGNDTVEGRGGDDSLRGDDGADSMVGGGGADTVLGGAGNDTLLGNAGNDLLEGGLDNDLIDGGGDNDTLIGANGLDTLLGSAGNDSLDGGGAADVLNGGAGSDTLIGSGGPDTFVFGTVAETGLGGTADRIMDFVSGSDKINLAGIAGLSFIGTNAFSNTAGELRYFNLAGVGYLAGDTTGNGVANFEILLINGAAVTAGDLILV